MENSAYDLNEPVAVGRLTAAGADGAVIGRQIPLAQLRADFQVSMIKGVGAGLFQGDADAVPFGVAPQPELRRPVLQCWISGANKSGSFSRRKALCCFVMRPISRTWLGCREDGAEVLDRLPQIAGNGLLGHVAGRSPAEGFQGDALDAVKRLRNHRNDRIPRPHRGEKLQAVKNSGISKSVTITSGAA